MSKRVQLSIFVFGLTWAMFTACFGCGSATDMDLEGVVQEEEAPDESIEATGQTFDPAVIAALDADYYIDFDNGTISLGDLPIGTRVVDPSWQWEFRLGSNYSDKDYFGEPTQPGIVKPVVWLVAAKNHYPDLDPHITLLSSELIGLFTFDNGFADRSEFRGSCHWRDSGTADAKHGLRPWLNSNGIHEGEGFYQAFPAHFKENLLTTFLPNTDSDDNLYFTEDKVFVPSLIELGKPTANIEKGMPFAYFSEAENEKRIAHLGGQDYFYWSRTPRKNMPHLGDSVYFVYPSGSYLGEIKGASQNYIGVRPVVNMRSEVLLSEVPKTSAETGEEAVASQDPVVENGHSEVEDETDISTGHLPKGNSNGNINNGGLVAHQDGWIYFANFNDDKKIYKSRPDGTELTQLNHENSGYLNVLGDWIYYLSFSDNNLYKMRTDGTMREPVYENQWNAYGINVVGDWIYFVDRGRSWKIFKVRHDGTELARIDDGLHGFKNFFINVVDDWIYYYRMCDQKLYRIRTDSTENSLLVDDKVNEFNVAGDWVYYVNLDDNMYIYKVRIDGTERTRIVDMASSNINVADDWIYFANIVCFEQNCQEIYRIKTDGTEPELLRQARANNIFVVDDWLYYSYYSEEHEGHKLYRMRTDGTKWQMVE